MLRVLLIPVNYKNYLISILEIDFWPYFIPAIIHYWVYFSLYVVIGVSIKDIQDLYNKGIPQTDKKKFIIYLSCIITLALLSILIIIYLIIYTVKMYKKHKQHLKQQ